MTREQRIGESFERLRTDKGIHNYAPIYASLPKDIKSIFEIGVYWGGSLITWADFFPEANPIYGLDINLSLLKSPESEWYNLKMDQNPRVHLIEADLRTFDPSGLLDFDLVIDDGTHETEHVLGMWDRLHRKAKRFYIIEDVYFSRMAEIWKHIVSDVPKAYVTFCRTSDHCGDDRILPDSDSNCIIVKF